MITRLSTTRRIAQARAIARTYYEPGNQARCLKWVWRTKAQPEMGIGYRTFLRYLNDGNA